jgi:thioredoxin-like negative regulator of GroEL
MAFIAVLAAAGVGYGVYTQVFASGKPPIYDSATFEEALSANASDGRWMIAKFTASWCPPCKVMDREALRDASVVGWLSEHARTIPVDLDQRRDLARDFGIRSIPTVIAFRDGQEVARRSFMDAGDMTAWFGELERQQAGAERAARRAERTKSADASTP